MKRLCDYLKESLLIEKAVSKEQQRLMGMAWAVRSGQMDRDKATEEVLKLADSGIKDKDLKDFAKTTHKEIEDLQKDKEEDKEENIEESFILTEKYGNDTVMKTVMLSELKKGTFFKFVGKKTVYIFDGGGLKRGLNYSNAEDTSYFKTLKKDKDVEIGFEY